MGMITGTDIYDQIDTLSGSKREEYIKNLFLTTSQVLPDSIKPIPITISGKALNGDDIVITYEALSDYLAGGIEGNLFRLPLCPKTAQTIADQLGCSLPTKKMVDQIYHAATTKLSPQPISPKKGEAHRESSITFRRHNLMIENQLKNKINVGLIAGHKKDIILTNRLLSVKGKVAIYGWHLLDGKAIQPVYVGHGDFYVDYSHGVRLIKKTVIVNGVKRKLEDVLNDKEIAHLLSDEGILKYMKYV
jgi:hypothetical protein